MLVKKVNYFGEFGYLNSSYIREKWSHLMLCPVVLTWSAMALPSHADGLRVTSPKTVCAGGYYGWGIVIFSEGRKVFGFAIMKPSFSLTNVKSITIPAICSVNNFGLLRTIPQPLLATSGKTTGHNIKWDHFDILARGKTDYHCKIEKTLFIQELEPVFNVNVESEKLMLY